MFDAPSEKEEAVYQHVTNRAHVSSDWRRPAHSTSSSVNGPSHTQRPDDVQCRALQSAVKFSKTEVQWLELGPALIWLAAFPCLLLEFSHAKTDSYMDAEHFSRSNGI